MAVSASEASRLRTRTAVLVQRSDRTAVVSRCISSSAAECQTTVCAARRRAAEMSGGGKAYLFFARLGLAELRGET
jgi:hypothetical protein